MLPVLSLSIARLQEDSDKWLQEAALAQAEVSHSASFGNHGKRLFILNAGKDGRKFKDLNPNFFEFDVDPIMVAY